jgi:hypothetical protein
MLLDGRGENHYVIKIQQQGLALLVAKNPLHQTLECTGSVAKPKGHAKGGTKGRLGTVSLCHGDLIVATSQVQGGKPTSTSEDIQGLIDAGQWKGILPGFTIQEPIIHTYAKATVLLLDQHNWRGIWAAALPNDLSRHQLVNVVFNNLILRWRNLAITLSYRSII